MKTSIYHYKTASRYLLDRVVEKQKLDRHFSIRKWSKEMGFPSHSLLAMVLQGKRNLTLKQVPYIAKGLRLSTAEKLFFQGLIQVETARTPEEKDWCELWLSELRPQSLDQSVVREVDQYLSIANWVHPALLALSDTRDSFRSADEAASLLGGAVAQVEVRAALERLSLLKLIAKNEQGVFRSTCHRMTTKDDIVNRGGREYHKQSAALASERIDSQDVLDREFQSMAIAVPSSRLPLAKEMIRKFRTQFSEAMFSENCDQVYQFNLHFFRLSKCPSGRGALKENDVTDFQQLPSGVHSGEVQ